MEIVLQQLFVLIQILWNVWSQWLPDIICHQLACQFYIQSTFLEHQLCAWRSAGLGELTGSRLPAPPPPGGECSSADGGDRDWAQRQMLL